jgi:signal transduction histidine kinase
VSRFDGKSFTNFTTEQGLANNNIWSALEDKNGNLWFATYGGGVSRYDGKTFTNFTTEDGLAGNDVWNVVEDKMGNLWFGTSGGGVSRYDGKSFFNISTKQGLADDKVYDIIIDSRENIFIGTSLGFSVLKEFKSITADSKIVPAINGLRTEELKKYQPVFEIYNKQTGYPIKDININAMYSDSKGIIWAGGGDNKLIRFDYNAVLKSAEAPNVIIQSVKIQEQPISWYNLLQGKKSRDPVVDSLALQNEEASLFGEKLSDEERELIRDKFSRIKFKSITPFYAIPQNLVLPYSYNSVTFDFVAIEPARHFLVRYQYMLEGYDKNWSPVTDKTNATFGNIPEGKYTFRLKARSPDGVWTEPVSYTFRVLPPWYRTWWAYLLFAVLLIGIIWAFIHYRSTSLRKEKQLLEEKVTQRTHQLTQSLQELKATQKQLVQSEKMASLGELTAGIAHEIQNPLNFVNNFSEVNHELLAEMKDEIDKGNFNEVKSIANDVIENHKKINYHGKRADAIVKSMLQHSRTSSNKKEPTDINALADEYLRLAYHGLRAKDKHFNATIKTDFDESLSANGAGGVRVSVIPQDIGRVLLNLYNNAFYAVTEKKMQHPDGYEPTVSVRTRKINDKIEIRIADNGDGIPQKVIEKIFQPFFTTKPTGQGTGLGLSLSYDIVKAHGGEIVVETKESEGTEVIVKLKA